jgi:hypothetical protein
MSNRIRYDAHAPHGALLAESVAAFITSREKIARVLDAVQAMSYGAPADVAAIRAELGLTSDQDALDLQFLLTSMRDVMANQLSHAFTDRLDQG